MTDDVLEQAWTQLARLRLHGIAHRDLRLANVFLDSSGQLFLIDFGFSELAAEELLLQTDVAELLASSAVVVGAQRSVTSAIRGLGAEPVVQAAVRLVPGRLSGATRTAMKAHPGLLDDLRTRAAAAARTVEQRTADGEAPGLQGRIDAGPPAPGPAGPISRHEPCWRTACSSPGTPGGTPRWARSGAWRR